MKELSFLKKNKNGVVMGAVLFILLNIMFFSMALLFVRDRTGGDEVKEKILAKEIALFINSAEPETLILFDIQEYRDIASENRIPDERMIKIEDGKVIVALKGTEFSYPYFSDYKISGNISGNFYEVRIE
jgi:hypothetical protein